MPVRRAAVVPARRAAAVTRPQGPAVLAAAAWAGPVEPPGISGARLKNPPVKSAGCGKPATITSATKTIMSGGIQRTYMVDVPADYDPAKPYRLFFASHGQGSTLANITQSNYYDLKTQSIAAKEPAIFVAALGYGGMPGTSGMAWGQADHAFFDDLTKFLEDNTVHRYDARLRHRNEHGGNVNLLALHDPPDKNPGRRRARPDQLPYLAPRRKVSRLRSPGCRRPA